MKHTLAHCPVPPVQSFLLPSLSLLPHLRSVCTISILISVSCCVCFVSSGFGSHLWGAISPLFILFLAGLFAFVLHIPRAFWINLRSSHLPLLYLPRTFTMLSITNLRAGLDPRMTPIQDHRCHGSLWAKFSYSDPDELRLSWLGRGPLFEKGCAALRMVHGVDTNPSSIHASNRRS